MNYWEMMPQDLPLMDRELIYKRFDALSLERDHEHCNLCGDTFSEYGEGDLAAGYATVDDIYWICDECFKDLHEQFRWKIVDGE